MPRIEANRLTEFARSLFLAAGVPDEEARTVAACLVTSDLAGHASHGVLRIPSYLKWLASGELRAQAPLEVLHETPALLATDAHLGFGQVQAGRLLERVMEKARQVGVASGTARNCGHVGRLADYAHRAAEAQLAAWLTVNDNGILRLVAPPGGSQARISTNPLALGVPTREGPIVYDASTSIVAHGKVVAHQLDGTPCPPGWLQDAEGRPTTDPFALKADPPGTLLPLDGGRGYKGFGLGLLLDMLVGGLSGGFCPPPQPGAANANTLLLVVWDPAHFAGQEHFLTQATGLAQSVRSCPPLPGAPPIRLPGEGGQQARLRNLEQGVPIRQGTWDQLVAAAKERNVTLPPQTSEEAARDGIEDG